MTPTRTMLYDGDCGICARVAAAFMRQRSRSGIEWRPWQGEPSLPTGVTAARLSTEIVLVEGTRIFGGAQAFARQFALTPGQRWLGAILSWPGLRAVAAWSYRRIAMRRSAISRRLCLTACGLREPARSGDLNAGEPPPSP